MSVDLRTDYQDLEVAESYDRQRFSSLSGRIFQWAERRALERILRGLPPEASILDAPCGTGRLMPLFLGRGWRTIGADISGEMIAVARRRTAGWNGLTSFCRSDFLQIPLTDRSVTATFSLRFLVHIPPVERVRMLREFRRVSRHCVVISVSLSTPWHRLRRRIKGWLGHPKPVRHPVTNHALAAELRSAGLQEVGRAWTCPLLSEQLFVVCEPTR
jgi:ubiquinone/menaquinone biosynthesis C-methylase UbiE